MRIIAGLGGGETMFDSFVAEVRICDRRENVSGKVLIHIS